MRLASALVENSRKQLLQAHGVLTCLYEVLLHAGGDAAVSLRAGGHTSRPASLIKSVEELDCVRLYPLLDVLAPCPTHPTGGTNGSARASGMNSSPPMARFPFRTYFRVERSTPIVVAVIHARPPSTLAEARVTFPLKRQSARLLSTKAADIGYALLSQVTSC